MNQKIKMTINYLILIFVFIGCSGKKIEFPATSIKTESGNFVSNTSTFQLGNKEYRADYGIITVPENRNNAASRLIHLPVIRIHAHSKIPREPIFGLAGGPGQTNINWSPIDSLLHNHDFVMVGYRGVDGSTILDCPEVAEALKNGDENNLLSENSLKNITLAWKASLKRLKSEAVDLDGYTIPETIEDMETVRRIFKYDRIDLLSESYGTRIAYIYGLMYPEKIYRSVMIGINPPGRFIWDGKRTDEQIIYYSRLWSKDSAMSKMSNDLVGTIKNVLNTMPRKWLFFSINPGKVRATTFALLFHRKTAAMVFDSYISAEKGDYSGLAFMSLAFDYTFPKIIVLGDLVTKAASADFNYSKEINVRDKEQNVILGSPLNDIIWKPFLDGGFQIKLIPDTLQSYRESDVQTLMLSGSVDFANPKEWVKEFLPYLKNGKQIILSEYGHVGDLRWLRKGTAERIITNYFNMGIIDTSKIEYIPMDFNVTWGFPLIAKIAISSITIIIIVLLACIIWIIKKVKRNRLNASLMKHEKI